MKRTPFTHPQVGAYRIASFPNGQWQFQSHHGEGSPTHDPWQGEHRPTTLSEAKRQFMVAVSKLGIVLKGELTQ